MPVEIEIDFPIPGDIVGSTFTVSGTYTLTRTLVKKDAKLTSVVPGEVWVTILRSDGTAFLTGGAGSDTMVANPKKALDITTEGSGTWSVNFTYNMVSYDNLKVHARLIPNSGNPDDDLVEDVDIGVHAIGL